MSDTVNLLDFHVSITKPEGDVEFSHYLPLVPLLRSTDCLHLPAVALRSLGIRCPRGIGLPVRGLKPCGEFRGEGANKNQSVESNTSQSLISYYPLEKGRPLGKRMLNDSWLSRRFARQGGRPGSGLGNLGFFLDLLISYTSVNVTT